MISVSSVIAEGWGVQGNVILEHTPAPKVMKQSMTNKILEKKNLIRERFQNCGGALQIFKAVCILKNHLLSLKLLASKISSDGYTNRSPNLH